VIRLLRPVERKGHTAAVLGACVAAACTVASCAVASGSGAGAVAPARWRHIDRGLLPATYVISLAVSASDPATMYAGTIRHSIAKSIDGGGSWRPTGQLPLLADGAVPRPTDVMSLAVDPADPGTVYAGTNFGGVLKSVDGGDSWKLANRGLRPTPFFRARVYNPVVSLLLDVRAPKTIYAAVAGTGVFVSHDGAAHWRLFAPGLPEPRVESLARAGATLYAATAGGVFMSSRSGWRAAGLRGRWLEAIAVDTAGTVYAGALEEGVFASRDRGRTWRRAITGLGNLYVRTLLADPRRAGRIYAGTYGGVFASSDSAATWSALNDGLGNRLVQALALRLGRSPSLYAGTLGSGVYVLARP
jgi:photosystem II stability/assembly factor-like uncharacterized protein